MNNKVFVSAGEMSGDLHLSYIIEEMKKKDKNLQFYGVVGDKSIEAGAVEVNHIKNNNIMGFVEAIKKYKYLKNKAVEYVQFIKKNNIQTVIFVDFGGFNLKFFKLLKKEIPNIKTIYYIPPKVWAWGKKRINTLKKFDEIIVIFPFEKKYFDSIKDKISLDVKYFGNPLINKYYFEKEYNNKILLLPGSRKQEINNFIPTIIDFIRNKNMKNEKFILKLADKTHIKYINELEKKYKFNINKIKNLEISYDNLQSLCKQCKYGIATSGTVTFELALIGLPVIVVYKTSLINAFIAKKILKIKYISLTNINSDEKIFEELLQENFNIENLLYNCQKMNKEFLNIKKKLKKERIKFGDENVLTKISNYIIEKINN